VNRPADSSSTCTSPWSTKATSKPPTRPPPSRCRHGLQDSRRCRRCPSTSNVRPRRCSPGTTSSPTNFGAAEAARDVVVSERTVRPGETGETIAEGIRRQIARGDLPIGTRLPPEDELTAQYGIARTTLREALRILESQGLLEIRRGRTGGPVVTMPGIDSLAEVLAVTLQLQGTTAGDLDAARQLLKPQLTARLAKSHDADDLAALHVAVDQAAAAAAASDRVAFSVAALAMHETLID
jgi:DNA-binding GntR family transcriptional regulator